MLLTTCQPQENQIVKHCSEERNGLWPGEQEPRHASSPWRGLGVPPLNTVVGEGLQSTLFTQGTQGLSLMGFQDEIPYI